MVENRSVQLKLQLCRRAGGEAGYQPRRCRFDPKFHPAVRAKTRLTHSRLRSVVGCQGCHAIGAVAGQHKGKRRGLERRLPRCFTNAFSDGHTPLTSHPRAGQADGFDVDNRTGHHRTMRWGPTPASRGRHAPRYCLRRSARGLRTRHPATGCADLAKSDRHRSDRATGWTMSLASAAPIRHPAPHGLPKGCPKRCAPVAASPPPVP